MQAAASGIEKDFTLLVSSFREGNYLKLITIAEQNPDLLISQIRQNPKALLIQNPEGNTFLHELTEQGHKELAIQLAKLNSYDIKIENGYIKFLYDSPGFLNYSDIKIAEKSIQNSAEIKLEELHLREQFEMAYADFPAIASNPPPLEELREMFSSTKIALSYPELREKLDEVQQEHTSIFGKSLGEEEQPLLEKEKSALQSSPTLPIPQEIKQQKQESSINEDQKNHTEIITPLTPITIREKDEDGNTRIHKLIESKKVTELKRFIEENTEILKATPIIDEFETVPAICLRNDRGENPLHMMLLDLDTWGDELIIQVAKLHPGMIHVEDNFGIIPFDLTQPKSNLEKTFIELDPLANNFGKARKIDIEENNQNNKKGKEPIQEIRRRKGPDEGKLITVNPSQELRQRKGKIRNLTIQQVSDYAVQKMLNEKLIEACEEKKYSKAGLLVRQGANPHAQDKNGQSAISYARNTNNTKLLKILEDEENKKTVFPTIIQSPNQKKEKLPLPAYTTFGSIIGGTLGASGCLLVASVYAGSWAFPPAGVALTIIGGCMALGFIAGAIISKSNIDSTTPFLKKNEKDNNNEKENKNQDKTIEVSDRSPSMNS